MVKVISIIFKITEYLYHINLEELNSLMIKYIFNKCIGCPIQNVLKMIILFFVFSNAMQHFN
jgi:hypothetical protein